MNNNQRDPRWANNLLGNSSLTIGADGCVISCIGDAIGTTPDIVNNLLKSIEGFEGALVIWSKLAQAFPGINTRVYNIYDNNAVLQSLAAGNRVLVFVSASPIGGAGEHCIEYIGNGLCKDPWTGTIRPTGDFPDVLGEWIEVTGTWNLQPQNPSSTSAVNAEGLNTYGLDDTNTASKQIVYDEFHKVQQGLYVPVKNYIQLKQTLEDLQKEISDLQLKRNEDAKEIVNLNSALSAFSTSNKDYATEKLDAEKIADTYTKYMGDFATTAGIQEDGQTDQQLHDEIITAIKKSHENEKTPPPTTDPIQAQSIWEGGLKKIVTFLMDHGFTEFLQENNLHVIDEKGNFVDDAVSDRVIAYLDDRFSRLDFLEKAINGVKTQVGKSRNLFTQLFGLFYKSV